MSEKSDVITNPKHYCEGRKFEPKDVIRDWQLNFNLGNVVKYIARNGRKEGESAIKDLEKARQYLTFEIYYLCEQKAHEFADYPIGNIQNNTCNYLYASLGLAEEAGEVAGKFAKAIKDSNGAIDEERKAQIVKELGDVCWFVAELATVLDVTLEEVMQKNIDKLADRKNRNVIHGAGDDR